jgi:outer membrane protein
MLIKRAALAAISFFAVLATARALDTGQAEGLDIEGAVKFAVERNLGLGRDALSLAALDRAAKASGNLLYPTVSAGTGVTRSSSKSYTSEAQRWSAYGSLSLSLSLSPSIRAKIDKLRLQYESGLVSYEQARRSLELEVRSSFYSILLAQAKLDLALQNRERERASYEQVKTKSAAGLAPELDLLSAQASYEATVPSVASARATVEDDLADFRLLLGLDADAPLKLKGSLDQARAVTQDAAAAAVEKAQGSESLALLSLRKQLEVARVSRRLAAASVASPSLALAAKTYPLLSDWDSGGSLNDTGSVSLGLSLPLDGLLPSSSARVALAEADDEIASLESQIKEEKASGESSVVSLARSISTAALSLASLETYATLAQKKYDLTREAYQKGFKDLSDVESAASDLDSARLDVLSQEYTLLAKGLSLESELGLDFGTIGR